jgi:deoxyribodipyrimidine photo-lyase
MAAIMWFRRDLRLADNPALTAAAAAGGPVLGVFVLDPALTAVSGAPRLAVLYRTLRVLDSQLGGALVIRHGSPAAVLAELCRETGAQSVHCAADFGPYGTARDEAVSRALPVPLVRTGSAYAVSPGRITNSAGQPYQVYSAFYRGWLAHGWRAPAPAGPTPWLPAGEVGTEDLPPEPELPPQLRLPEVGEPAARQAWQAFLAGPIEQYRQDRNRPDRAGTSRMSVHLKWGTLHPRTLLADLQPRHEVYRKELAWREFYADVLHHRPDSAREHYRSELAGLPQATGDLARQRLDAWAAGRTGYPIVDAGMRQLRAEGWMHNRVRMIVASFLVKDLHLPWQAGARHFQAHLVDGDLASNAHGWQWVAGTGTDPAPYFRIFNPVVQGQKFDPAGEYVRRYVPELAGLPTGYIHEPWRGPDGLPPGYPERIVDHATERAAALAAYQELRDGGR